MEALFGSILMSKSGPVETSSVQAKYKLLYFSAHWCPPCRGFTPMLALFYNEVNAVERQVEVVFVSSDKSEEEFNEYYNEMPWLALPYQDRAKAQELSKRFCVHGIPSLFLLDQDGNMKHSGCRNDIQDQGPECLADWDEILSS